MPVKTRSGMYLTDLSCITAWETLFNFVSASLKPFGNKRKKPGLVSFASPFPLSSKGLLALTSETEDMLYLQTVDSSHLNS